MVTGREGSVGDRTGTVRLFRPFTSPQKLDCRRALRRFLPELQDQTEADLTVVNAENAAGGFGVTAGVLEEFLEQSEIDVLTSGNHIWDKREALDLIQESLLLGPVFPRPKTHYRFWLET